LQIEPRGDQKDDCGVNIYLDDDDNDIIVDDDGYDDYHYDDDRDDDSCYGQSL